ncbi:DNA-binding protein WhiA [Streptococcus suis]
MSHHKKPNLKKNREYAVMIEYGVNEKLKDLHLADRFFGLETGISPLVMENDSWSKAYLRGSFLAARTVKDTEK